MSNRVGPNKGLFTVSDCVSDYEITNKWMDGGIHIEQQSTSKEIIANAIAHCELLYIKLYTYCTQITSLIEALTEE